MRHFNRFTFVIALLFILPPVLSVAGTWYVSPTGSNTTGNGSLANPWQTFGFAISSVSVVNGDLIIGAAGAYNENLSFPKSVTLRGAGNGIDGYTRNNTGILNPAIETIVHGQLNAAANVTVDGIAFDVVVSGYGGAALSNFTLTNCIFINGAIGNGASGQATIEGSGSNIQITHNAFFGGPNSNHDNLWLFALGGPMTNISVSANHFIRGLHGIFQANDSMNLNLTNNIFNGCQYAAVFQRLSDPVITGNVFDSCSNLCLQVGSHGGTIHDNICQNSLYGAGLELFGGIWNSWTCSDLRIFNNQFINNNTGISLLDGAGGTTGHELNLHNNTVTGNYLGVLISSVRNIIFTNNNISQNQEGLWSLDSTSVSVANNWWGSESGPYNDPFNLSGTGNEIGIYGEGAVVFTPWIGMAESQNITNADLNIPRLFAQANTTLTFTSLPAGTNTPCSVQRLTAPPAGVPNPPAFAGSAPVFLDISAPNLVNGTFQVTVVLDISAISGFSTATEVMFYSTISNSWVGAAGVYDAAAHTYTFVMNHFTLFAFVNPLNPDGLYVSQSITHPQTGQKWYPQAGMGNASPYGNNDWTYVNDTARFYVVPSGTQGLFAAKFQVTWDKSKANLVVSNGNLWGSNMFCQVIDSSSGDNGKYWFNISSNDLTNAIPDTIGGKYLAVLKFAITKPGYIPVSILGTDFRRFSADSASGVFVTTNPGAMLFYLGDFASASSQNIGDGRIDFSDLSLFSSAYWSLSTDSVHYRIKYDIGPTDANGSYWAMPERDNQIEFEDLVIFAIGYAKTGSGQLPQKKLNQPVIFSTLDMVTGEDGILKLPVQISGAVNDVRAFSMVMDYSGGSLEYAGVEKAGEMLNGTTFIIGKTDDNKIKIDGAVIGGSGISHEGVFANVLFRVKTNGARSCVFEEVRARNSSNTALIVQLNGKQNGTSGIPTAFGISQNYPNPFNPNTTIKYQVPKSIKVTLRVYDLLGRLVTTLADGVQDAGYYSVEWNAINYASGVYFYKMTAGNFESVKKLVLIK